MEHNEHHVTLLIKLISFGEPLCAPTCDCDLIGYNVLHMAV